MYNPFSTYSQTHLTTVSKSIDFLPLAGNHSLKVGNNPLLFFVPEAMQTAVIVCNRAIKRDHQASTYQPWRPPTSHGHHDASPQMPRHENNSQYVVKLANVATKNNVSLLYNQTISGANGDGVSAAAGNNACRCAVAISGKSGAIGLSYGPIGIVLQLHFCGHRHGRTTAARLVDASFTYHYARGGGHNLLQPLYVATGTKKGGGNYPPRASNYPPKGENQSIWKLQSTIWQYT